MAKKPLPTPEELRQLLRYEPDTGKLFWRERQGVTPEIKRWNTRYSGNEAGRVNGEGYRHVRVNGRDYKTHRIVWIWETGRWPVDQIDHINRIKTDNRFCNLREVTNAENHQNRNIVANNTSGYTGVSYEKGKWRANIKHMGKHHFLGYFGTAEEASRAYQEAKPMFHRTSRACAAWDLLPGYLKGRQ